MWWLVLTFIPLSVVVMLWLMQATSKRHSFVVFSSAVKKDLYEYLSTPNNLIKYHPTIRTVMNVKQENQAICCTVAEDLGLLGKVRAPMSLVAFPDTPTPASSSVCMEFGDQGKKVIVKLTISEHNDINSHEKCKIDVSFTVEGYRFFTFLFHSLLFQMWVKAVDKLVNLWDHQIESNAAK